MSATWLLGIGEAEKSSVASWFSMHKIECLGLQTKLATQVLECEADLQYSSQCFFISIVSDKVL